MQTVKLVKVETYVKEETIFGTCDLCEYTADHIYDVAEFETSSGEKFTIELGRWVYGSYIDFALTEDGIDNLEKWLSKVQFPDGRIEDTLESIVLYWGWNEIDDTFYSDEVLSDYGITLREV